MSISFAERLVQPREVLVQEMDGESVLLHVGTGEYFGLDETGCAMWTALTSSPSIQAAFETVLDTFDVEHARLEADLTALIEQLLSHGLLEIACP